MPVDITQQEYEQALTRGREALAQPHVIRARYIASADALELVYSNGLLLRFRPRDTVLLRDIPKATLAHPYVTPGGDGLLFDDAALAVSIPGLVSKLIPLDTARMAVAAARGRVTSPAKAEAARRNGLKGGRPTKLGLIG
ncbi:MAG: hypothetical protein ACRYG5_09740 [Janthinobacterium lividum]